jgi:hypothetical protein
VNYLTVTHDHPVPGAVFLRDAFYRVNRAGQHDLEPIYERIDSDVLGDKRLILVFTYERIDYCT